MARHDRRRRRSDAVFLLAGVWVLLNALIISVAAVLAFRRHDLIYRPAGLGPQRVAIADLFHPFQNFTGFFLIGIAAAVAAVGIGMILRQAWTRFVLLITLSAAVAGTLFAVAWGVSNAESGVVWGGVVKLAIYTAGLVLLTRPAVIRAFRGMERS